MNKYFALWSLLFIFTFGVTQMMNKKEVEIKKLDVKPPNKDNRISKDDFFKIEDILFSYKFSVDTNYIYHIVKDSMDKNNDRIYSVLYLRGKEVNRRKLNEEYLSFYKKASLLKSIVKPKIGDIDEIIIISNGVVA